MTFSQQSNQGVSNSYSSVIGTAPASIRPRIPTHTHAKKIENSRGFGIKSSTMTHNDRHENMRPFDEDASDYSDNAGTDDEYFGSDAELGSDTEFGHEDRCDYQWTDEQKVADEIEADEKEEKHYTDSNVVQNPDDMEHIRPARQTPPEAEQLAEYYAFLDAERESTRKAEMNAFGKLLFKSWSILHSNAEKIHGRKMHQMWRRTEIAKYKAPLRPAKILTLTPFVPISIDDEWAEMKKRQEICKSIRTMAITIAFKAKQAKMEADAIDRFHKAGAERARQRKGMNKNSDWHAAQANGGVAIGYSEKEKKARAATLKARKERKEKEQAEWRKKCQEAQAEAQAQAVVETSDKSIVEQVFEISDSEDVDDKAEIDSALAAMNRICIEKTDARLAHEAKIAAEEKKIADIAEAKRKAEEKKKAEEEATWTVVGKVLESDETKTKSKKIDASHLLNFTSTIDIKRKERAGGDAVYAKRSEAFEVMADPKKTAEALRNTSMCRSIAANKPCYHADCFFAHTVEDLVKKECRFETTCGFVKKIGPGQYISRKFGRTGKKCECYHPGETDQSYATRLGFKHLIKSTPTKIAPATKTPLTVSKLVTGETAWSKVVTAAETKDTLEKVKARMATPWNKIVIKSLTAEEKLVMYGKGASIVLAGMGDKDTLGVSSSAISVPLSEKSSDQRRDGDRRGVGFSSTKIDVTAPHFQWVSGGVLVPEKKTEPVIDDRMAKVLALVKTITSRIAAEQAAKEQAELEERVAKAKAKADEINARIAAKQAKEQAELAERVANAKAKADEINAILNSTIIFKVEAGSEEQAIRSAIRSGISNFKIITVGHH